MGGGGLYTNANQTSTVNQLLSSIAISSMHGVLMLAPTNYTRKKIERAPNRPLVTAADVERAQGRLTIAASQFELDVRERRTVAE